MTGIPRILSIIPYQVFPAKLGGEKGIALFNEHLSKQAELTAVTIQKNDPAYASYKLYNIVSNGRIRYVNIFLYFSIRKIVKREKATHLLIEHPYYGWLAWLIKRTTSITWVVHSHNMEYMRSKSIGRWWWKALMWYEGWVYRSADKTFYISEDDLEHAVQNFGADRKKSLAVTYGIEQTDLPGDNEQSSQAVRRKHGIEPGKKILLFNGALYHSTNYDALRIILDEINPLLMKVDGFNYVVLVCGRGLPDVFNELKEYTGKNIIYAGFVDDISIYFKAADIFLNPILSGGGVKTKAIEALAMNCSVISTPLGALGIKKEVCGDKLKVVKEGDWKVFADEIVRSAQYNGRVPEIFFEYYSWGNIIKKVIRFLSDDVT